MDGALGNFRRVLGRVKGWVLAVLVLGLLAQAFGALAYVFVRELAGLAWATA